MASKYAQWLTIACSQSVVQRALKVSLIVGSLLTAINQGDMLLAGIINTEIVIKILLTYCVPYSVATYAAVSAILEKQNNE